VSSRPLDHKSGALTTTCVHQLHKRVLFRVIVHAFPCAADVQDNFLEGNVYSSNIVLFAIVDAYNVNTSQVLHLDKSTLKNLFCEHFAKAV